MTFAIVGVINTVVDFCVFSLVLLFVSVPFAQASGYTAGLICSFFLNKYVTFKNYSKSLRQWFLFLLVNGFTMLVSTFVISFLHSLGLQEHLAKLLFVTPLTMTLNYLGYTYVVFAQKEQETWGRK